MTHISISAGYTYIPYETQHFADGFSATVATWSYNDGTYKKGYTVKHYGTVVEHVTGYETTNENGKVTLHEDILRDAFFFICDRDYDVPHRRPLQLTPAQQKRHDRYIKGKA